MSRIQYYDRNGEPMSRDAWVATFDDAERTVAKTDVGGYHVSTVWLGLDHRFGGKGPPLIFETMVFPAEEPDDRRRAEEEDERLYIPIRTPTEAAALAAHDQVVADCRDAARVEREA